MGCVVVCAAGAGAMADAAALALAAVVALAALALIVAVVSVLLGYAWALAVAVGVACVLGSVALVRVYRYGPTAEVFRRHRAASRRAVGSRLAVTRAAVSRREVPALPAGSSLRAIEGGRIEVTPGMVLGKAKEEAR